MKFNIIGAGRLGKNIALALSSTQIAVLNAVVNCSKQSAEQACFKIGSGNPVQSIDQLPCADIYWITSNDDSIPKIVSILANSTLLKPGNLIIHCSGVLSSTILAPLQAQGCMIASFHPLKAFKTDYLDANAFNNVDCVLEGDEEACTWIRKSFTGLGAHIIAIRPDAKATYHAAACIASNYLITLASFSEQLLLNVGLNPEQARRIVSNLMQGNLDNIKKCELIADALTGPIMRGDMDTLKLHLQALDNPILTDFYKTVGLATLTLTQLTEDKKEDIRHLFKK